MKDQLYKAHIMPMSWLEWNAKKAFNKQWKLYQKLGEKCFECEE